MLGIFNYSTLKASLLPNTRTLRILIGKTDDQRTNLEMLFELENLLAWASSKVEIHSILIQANSKKVSEGLSSEFLSQLNENQVLRITQKMQKIVKALIHLPQVIIFDFANGTKNIFTELALGADIRLAQSGANISLEHAQKGIVASSGGISLLNKLVGQAMSRNWLLMGKNICMKQMTSSGFIYQCYDSTNKDNVIQDVLSTIRKQAPVARIQNKLGLFESLKSDIDSLNQIESQIALATMTTGDWKKIAEEDFMPAKSTSYAVKLSLVKENNNSDQLS